MPFEVSEKFGGIFVKYIYTGRVETVCRLSGIEKAFEPIDVPNTEITVKGETCTFYVDSPREQVWWESYFESPARLGGDMPVLNEITQEINPDDCFWDVGGNIGIYSCHVAKQIDSGSVIAVEPNPKNADRVRMNLSLNDVVGSVYQLALSSGRGELDLFVSDVPGSYGTTHSLPWIGWNTVTSITVECLSGDTFRTDYDVPPPDVMKIDVEGAEYDVLNGLEETLSSGDCRLVYCNIHSSADSGVTDEETHKLLQEYGYEVERIWEWPTGEGHFIRGKRG